MIAWRILIAFCWKALGRSPACVWSRFDFSNQQSTIGVQLEQHGSGSRRRPLTPYHIDFLQKKGPALTGPTWIFRVPPKRSIAPAAGLLAAVSRIAGE